MSGNSTNAQKTWFGGSMSRFSEAKIADAIHLLGKALPCSIAKVTNGGIVVVKFEVDAAPFTLPQVTVPIATCMYNVPPLQVGDKGFVTTADVRLGGVTGLGSGAAKLSRPANLTALVFVPLGNADWEASPDANAYLIQGPNGFILRNLADDYSIVGNADGINIKWGSSASILLDDDGIHMTGVLEINGNAYLDHTHTEVTTGSDDTGPVT